MIELNTNQNIIENQNEEIKDNNDLLKSKITVISLLLIISLPFITLDLYYEYNDKSCISIYSNSFNIRIKEYLLVCGYLYLIILTIILLLLIFVNKKNGKNIGIFIEFYNINFNSWILAFMMGWDIIGLIIFLNQIYPLNICNLNISNYLFASIILKLILKLLFCFLNFQK